MSVRRSKGWTMIYRKHFNIEESCSIHRIRLHLLAFKFTSVTLFLLALAPGRMS